MSHRRAFWIAVALLIGSLLPLFLGELRSFDGAWIGLVGSLTGLGVSSADQLVGRAYRQREHPWGDGFLVLIVSASLTVLWANFLYVDAWNGWWGRVILGPIAVGALGLPLLRWLGEPFPRSPFWALVGACTGLSSATLLYAWKWNHARYEMDAFGPEELFVFSLAASPWVLGLPLVALLRLDRDAERVHPRNLLRTAVAGALIGLAHAETWTLVRYDTIHSSYTYGYGGGGATDAYEACLWGTLALLYGLGPTVISRLLGSYERSREPALEPDESAPVPSSTNEEAVLEAHPDGAAVPGGLR